MEGNDGECNAAPIKYPRFRLILTMLAWVMNAMVDGLYPWSRKG